MPIDWSPLLPLISASSHIVLMTHQKPDGDAIGSQMALKLALEALGKTVAVVVATPFPAWLNFLDPDNIVRQFRADDPDLLAADTSIVVDTGTFNQIGAFGDWLKTRDIRKLVIDHHRTQDDMGGVRFVDIEAEACVRLVREAIAALDVPLTREMAIPLYVGLLTDTGHFRHGNTQPRSFRLAAELMEAGVDPTWMGEQMAEKITLKRWKLVERGLANLTVSEDGRIGYTWLTLDDFARTRSSTLDTEGMIDYPRGLDGVEVALMFTEMPGGTSSRVSFRSRSLDVSKIAETFGGGGHKLACGATIPHPLELARELVVGEVRRALDVG